MKYILYTLLLCILLGCSKSADINTNGDIGSNTGSISTSLGGEGQHLDTSKDELSYIFDQQIQYGSDVVQDMDCMSFMELSAQKYCTVEKIKIQQFNDKSEEISWEDIYTQSIDEILNFDCMTLQKSGEAIFCKKEQIRLNNILDSIEKNKVQQIQNVTENTHLYQPMLDTPTIEK